MISGCEEGADGLEDCRDSLAPFHFRGDNHAVSYAALILPFQLSLNRRMLTMS